MIALFRKRRSAAIPEHAGKSRVWTLLGRLDAILGAVVACCVFLLVTAIGIGVFYEAALVPVRQWVHSLSWQETNCTILSCDVVTHETDEGVAYDIDIRYTYAWGDAEYTSDRYEWGLDGGDTIGFHRSAAIVSMFPVGTHATCYINPDNPQEAVLSRAFNRYLGFGLLLGGVWLVPLLCGLIVVALLISLLISSRRKRRPRKPK